MSWASPGQRWTVYLLVGLCALAVRFGYWGQIRGTALDEWHKWDQSDMATFVEQARRLAAGDWLARKPYHPYHAWQQVASEADWQRWYGPLSFHQAPLYSYWLAALSELRADYLPLAKALQLVLGACTCALLAHLAGRMGGVAVAVVAGLCAAWYGPLYYLEPQLLREGPAVFGFLAVVLLAMRHAELPRESPLRRLAGSAGALGLLIGAYALFYETAAVLALAATGVVAVHAARSSARRPTIVVAALVAGYAVGVSPLLARNAAIGAPLSTGSSRLGINLAYCNMSSAVDGGATFRPPGPQFAQIMDASEGSTWKIAREVWRGYDGQRSLLLRNWAHRLRALSVSAEIPDNTSYGFYRRHSSILSRSLSFRWIFPAAAALWLVWLVEQIAARGRRDAPVQSEPFRLGPWLAERTRAHATLLAFTLLLALAMTVVPSQSRYRLFLVPAFIVYTSFALVAAARWLAARQLGWAAGMAGAIALQAAFHAWLSEPRARAEDRYMDYTVAGSIYRQRGNEAAAEEYFRRRVIGPSSDRAHEIVPDER